ncbi:MAG: hypothetical protein KAS72_03180, partial [Phycisphaerales bacterium]|nr:hypothetical protein [Phycisphaerales bacterium]
CDVPAPNTGFVSVAAGSYHGLGLKDDGSIVAWGKNTCGQCDVPEPNTGFVSVAAGNSHSLGLKGIPACPGDLDGDGDVDQNDLGILLAYYNINDGGDLDDDGDTDQNDLGILLADYGCPWL